ncbi:hypothetical protein Dimus_027869 [Dionaea muscipula]
MANLIRRFGGKSTLLRQPRTLIDLIQSPNPSIPSTAPHLPRAAQAQAQSTRNYITEMRRSAFEANLLRLLRHEIQYEINRSPLEQPVAEINGFTVDQRPGEKLITLEKQFGEDEKIKVEVTMFDRAVPVSKSHDEKAGKVVEEVKLHITAVVSVFKEGSDDALEFGCSAWPDALDIYRVCVRARGLIPHQPYLGPLFKELDEKLQESLFEFLEVRGIDDALCTLLHKSIMDKDRTENIRWLGTVKSFVEKKAA